MSTPQENQFGDKIVSYLGSSPVVPADISARLAFAREVALEKAALVRTSEPVGEVLVSSSWHTPFRLMALAALLLMTLVVLNPPDLNPDLTPEQELELQYHQTADQAVSLDY